MNTRMTPSLVTSLAASLLLAASTLGTPAMAQPAPPNTSTQEAHGEHKPDRRTDRMGERQAERWDKRQADLKAGLKLTPAQAPAWESYQTATKPPAREDRAGRENVKREDWAKMKTPERLDRLRAWRQQHETVATQREDATRAFYATLSAEQQKTFDARTAQPFFGEAPEGRGPR